MNDPRLENTSEDLRYIRNALGRQRDEPMPMYSRILWSLYAIIGFTLLDFYPEIAGWSLLWGLPACFLIDFVASLVFGPSDREKNYEEMKKWAGHMTSFILAVAATIALAYCGVFQNGYSVGQVILVLVGYHFFTCSLMYFSNLSLKGNGALLLGVLSIVAAILVSFVDKGVWTGIGIIMAIVFMMGFQLSGPSKQESQMVEA